MKKVILLIVGILFSGCGVPSMGIYDTHRQNIHRTHTPKYGLNDKVKYIIREQPGSFWHNTKVVELIIDSVEYGKNNYVFYCCHEVNTGTKFDRMSENSLR